ncbi:DUF417 family protein [Escherichia coli]|nr:DUF417 family protein [Escherichia coli]
MSIFDRYEFLVPEHGRRDLGLLRWALVIVFLWFGAMKFTAYEAYGIAPFIEHSPIMNWLGMFGTQGQSYFIGESSPVNTRPSFRNSMRTPR